MLTHFDVLILGGGFAGAVTAARLLRDEPDAPLRIGLVERRLPPGRGVAYGTPEDRHLLNLPAGEMSAYCEDPGHFVRWLKARGEPADADTFASRKLYGCYVEAVLDEATAHARPGRSLTILEDEAVGLLPDAEGYRVRLKSGPALWARQVVLAVGQFPPSPLRVEGACDTPRFVEDPWSPEALAPLDGEALVVGTGLTAVDVALTLLDRGAERVHMVSRRAQLPAASREGPPHRDWLDPAAAPTRVSALWRLVREEVARASDWRGAIDALKAHVPALWGRMPLVERRRFLRHARTYWEAHRNRLPPDTAARAAALQAAGRLTVTAGRLRRVEARGDRAIARVALRGGGERELAVSRVVAATGPDTQYRGIRHPLILDLIGAGLGRPDPLGLGLDVAPDGRLKDEDGVPTPGLFTLGWPRLGQLYEATTVPSLREQAREVAARLLASRAAR